MTNHRNDATALAFEQNLGVVHALLDVADAIREGNQPTESVVVREEVGTYVDVMFDGPPGPESGRFIEVENQHRASIRFGEWVEFSDGRWALRIRRGDVERIQPSVFDSRVENGGT
ncbi:hypothetical protein KNV15_gp86 [Gordonia phage Jambalaya]|uniref:Uncharacterized protein n=1 Tax=Gordonia phage Jambalaya TaxID=2743985 RepID=A0A7D5JIE1_9CAUD|nr:hypothetical protein KNV15_gp86 [Gordonia phage Jambalaya]QLF84131.1 hypothetical protein SEA_JAMBALAYA_86 [Gordonia phage Jambalaya]